ncbi:MAG TPA: hypothetical protein VFG69_06090 [Nannocystaceae bacterium]|nr:hypothetical protein [Nannocystaceae bacterium]
MTRLRLSLASVVLLGSLVAPACKHNTAGAGEAESPRGRVGKSEARRAAKRPDLPRPYSLPADPPMAMHVGAPAQVLAALESYVGRSGDPRSLLLSLAAYRGGAFEAALVPAIDLQRPWDAATIEGKSIVQLPIERAKMAQVKRLLLAKPAAGKFGAVDLQRPADQNGPKLAWLDEENATLALADDLRGLATAGELARAYGKSPLWFTIDAAQAKHEGAVEFPFSRIHVRGDGVHDFRITTEGPTQIEGLDAITEGALTGLLSSPDLAAAATTRYAGYQKVIKDLTGRATRTLNDQNFLVRGVMEDMVKRFNTVVRSWNGRVLVGVGPQHHIVLALGSEDAKKASSSAVSLMSAVMGNLSLASSFGLKLPHLRFQKNKISAEGIAIHGVALENARKQLPPELATLLDERGDLRMAFAGSPRAGAVLVVVGPDAPNALARWISQTKGATPGNATRDHLAAVTLATSTSGLAPLTQEQSAAPLLQLRADRPPTSAIVQRKGESFDVHVRGPAPAKPQRTAVSRRG